jgi:phage terminase small subunit
MGGRLSFDLEAIEREVCAMLDSQTTGAGEVDKALLGVLLENFRLLASLDRSIREDGEVIVLGNRCKAVHPAVRARDTTIRRIVMLCRELGVDLRRPAQESTSPYAELLKGYRRA